MSLIKCNECGNKLSSKAISCPHCGNMIRYGFLIWAFKQLAIGAYVLAVIVVFSYFASAFIIPHSSKNDDIDYEPDLESKTEEQIISEPSPELETETATRHSQLTMSSQVDETATNPEHPNLLSDEFEKIFSETKYWTADWGNDIRAAISKAPCKDKALIEEGYQYRAYSSLPIYKIPKISHSWYTFDDRAVTVSGCWFKKSNGIIHFKMTRKKDGKIFEQDISLLDGTWEARKYNENGETTEGKEGRGNVEPEKKNEQALTEETITAYESNPSGRSTKLESNPASEAKWWSISSNWKCTESSGPSGRLDTLNYLDHPTTVDFKDASGNLYKVEVSVPAGDGYTQVSTYYRRKQDCVDEVENGIRNLSDKYKN